MKKWYRIFLMQLDDNGVVMPSIPLNSNLQSNWNWFDTLEDAEDELRRRGRESDEGSLSLGHYMILPVYEL